MQGAFKKILLRATRKKNDTPSLVAERTVHFFAYIMCAVARSQQGQETNTLVDAVVGSTLVYILNSSITMGRGWRSLDRSCI
jgi:hypothetical protein